jgi:hypothetical protein
VKRNIPVTFGPPPADVINETIDPNEEPRVMKAQPVGSPSKFGTFSAPAPRTNASAKKALSKTNRGKTHATESPAEVRRALPIDHGKKN